MLIELLLSLIKHYELNGFFLILLCFISRMIKTLAYYLCIFYGALTI